MQGKVEEVLPISAAFVAVMLLTACAQSSVGGKVQYGTLNDNRFSNLEADCNGKCTVLDNFGRCVQFSAGIQGVCAQHFLAMARVAATSGNCSPIVSETGGNVYINYNGC